MTWSRPWCILGLLQRGADRLELPKKPGRQEIDQDIADQDIAQAYLTHDRDAIALLDGWIRQTVQHEAWRFPFDHEDLAQDVHVRLSESLQKFRGGSALKTYVRKIAYRACVDHYRRIWRIVLIPDYPSSLSCTRPSPYDDLERTEEEKRVMGTLERIIQTATQRCRDLFRLIYYQNLKYRQIAEIMGLTEGVIKKRAFLCREKARIGFEKQSEHGNRNAAGPTI